MPAGLAHRCRFLLAGCCWAFVCAAAATPREDPMQSAACAVAMKRLASVEGSASQQSASAPQTPSVTLTQAQREAAVACLGAAALNPSARVGRVQPPLSVPPVQAAGRGGGVNGSAPAGAPATVPGIVSVTGCDANGCWASDGTRLTRDGLLLRGPRGACTVTGAVLNCP